MSLEEQFVKEYFDKAADEGLQINGVIFNQLRAQLYIKWLEKRATIHNKDYAVQAKLQQLRELLKHENYLPEKVVDLVNDNFWELL